MLVASLADHSLEASERAAAEAVIASCGLCAALHADLVALLAATRAMPTPARPRDFRLTREDADRARPGGWRRWVAAIGTSRDAFSRPLAMGLTTLGLVGLLAASLPSVLMTGGATSAPAADMSVGSGAGGATNAPERVEGGGSEVTGAQAPGDPVAPPATDNVAPAAASARPVPVAASPNALQGDRASPAADQGGTPAGPTIGTPNAGKGGGSTKAAGRDADGSAGAVSDAAGGSPAISPLVILSGALLIVGLGLFALRWGARRFGD
jgi:hypothetical protein